MLMEKGFSASALGLLASVWPSAFSNCERLGEIGGEGVFGVFQRLRLGFGRRSRSHCSKAAAAASRACSISARMAERRAFFCSQAARSAARGTSRMGGVSEMLPSITFCVVLRKKAPSA